jgi:hypothetical protein
MGNIFNINILKKVIIRINKVFLFWLNKLFIRVYKKA